MSALASPLDLDALPARQRMAFISLLVDDDPAIYQMVRSRLLASGRTATTWLHPYTLSNDPRMRRRAKEIVQRQARQQAHEDFLEFCQRVPGEELDLEQAVFLLARTRFPEASREAYSALCDTWAAELRARIQPTLTSPEQILGTISRFLFGELGFCGDEFYGSDPDTCYLNRIMDRRTGNPIGLCALFLFITRRLHLPVAGVGLPGHFICRYQAGAQEIYIDCFRQGAFLEKADCLRYLLQANFGQVGSQLSPVSPRRMLLRMCHNLVNTYGHLAQTEEAARSQRYVTALTR